jgi:hypothetical protein
MDTRPLSKQDLGLWGSVDGEGYLLLSSELFEHAPAKVLAESMLLTWFKTRPLCFPMLLTKPLCFSMLLTKLTSMLP